MPRPTRSPSGTSVTRSVPIAGLNSWDAGAFISVPNDVNRTPATSAAKPHGSNAAKQDTANASYAVLYCPTVRPSVSPDDTVPIGAGNGHIDDGRNGIPLRVDPRRAEFLLLSAVPPEGPDVAAVRQGPTCGNHVELLAHAAAPLRRIQRQTTLRQFASEFPYNLTIEPQRRGERTL
jgi:hypothetical protein